MDYLPILIQIPIFYTLYKILTITIKMRHTPFFNWIQDLSAPNPTTMFNLFNLIPWNPNSLPLINAIIAHLNVWPLLYDFTI